MRVSSSRCWRRRGHDLPRSSSKPSNNHARCPYRIVEQTTGREVDWINRYLDHEMLRRLADTTLRTLCARPAALSPLVGECSPHRRGHRRCPHRIDTAGLCAIPVRPATASLTGATINQRVAVVDRALRIDLPRRAPARSLRRFSQTYWQRAPMGIGRPRPGLEPVAREGSQTDHRAAVGRRGGALLVQLPHLTGPGHRRTDAAAGTSVREVLALNRDDLLLVRSADPRARQRQQDPFPAAGPGNDPTAGSLSAAGTAPIVATRLCLFL